MLNSLLVKYRFAIASVLIWLVVGALFAVGLHYVSSSQVMPYHEEIMEVPWTDLPPRVRMLLLTLMKGTGLVAISTAVSLSLLLAVPFRRREPWSRWAILLVAATALLPTLFGALRLRAEAGAASPWWPHVVLLLMVCLGFWLTRDFKQVE